MSSHPSLSWHPAHAVTADYSGRSNLALAFLCLGRDKRRDMNVFYTFCRLVDDIADSSDLPLETKREQLTAWRKVVQSSSNDKVPAKLLADEVRSLMAKYRLKSELMLEIIAGVEMDLDGASYETFEQLRAYCYRVASAVGLVSIEIFGYQNPACRNYAVDLGLALQLTNIIRDVGVDLDNGGRIYLPLEDLSRFNYSPEDLRNRVHDRAVHQVDGIRNPTRPRLLSTRRRGVARRGPSVNGGRRNHAGGVREDFGFGGSRRLPGFNQTLPSEQTREVPDPAGSFRAQPLVACPLSGDAVESTFVLLINPNPVSMLKRSLCSSLSICVATALTLNLTGCDTPVGQGAGIGAGTGAIIGGLATNRVGGAALGAAAGAVAGGLIGAAVEEDRAGEYGPRPSRGYPVAQPTDRPGFVLSPYSPYYEIDVRGVPRGALVRDPSCNRLFVKP